VDLRLGVAAVLATQATHLSHSSRVTSTSISVRTSSSSTRDISSATAAVPSEQPARRKSISALEQSGSPSSCPSYQLEQSSSTSSRRKSCMFPLWGTRPLGESLPKESSSAAFRSQCPSQTECNAARRQQPWATSCLVWKGEPLGG
jgi:hypothetical protein